MSSDHLRVVIIIIIIRDASNLAVKRNGNLHRNEGSADALARVGRHYSNRVCDAPPTAVASSFYEYSHYINTYLLVDRRQEQFIFYFIFFPDHINI